MISSLSRRLSQEIYRWILTCTTLTCIETSICSANRSQMLCFCFLTIHITTAPQFTNSLTHINCSKLCKSSNSSETSTASLLKARTTYMYREAIPVEKAWTIAWARVRLNKAILLSMINSSFMIQTRKTNTKPLLNFTKIWRQQISKKARKCF